MKDLELIEFTIASYDEETTCDYCGLALYKGDSALETKDQKYVYDSRYCAAKDQEVFPEKFKTF